MLIYNNLLINGHSNRFQPFLFNIVSGRRRLLKNDEVIIIKKMLRREEYDEESNVLLEQLIKEKQFYTDEMRKSIEDTLQNSGYWEKRDLYAKDYGFSIELTRACNMNCSFCYAGSRKKSSTMTKEHIDAIYSFYTKYADDPRKIEETPYIRITGGEALFNEQSARLIRYIAEKWKKAEIFLFTNGMNLLKYYHILPIDRLGEVHISVDGPSAVHLARRCPNTAGDESVFEDILNGIQRLLNDQVKVKVKTVLDRNNYVHIDELRQVLKEKGIHDSPYCEHLVGITLDFQNRLDIMEEVNDKEDIQKIEAHLSKLGMVSATYPSLSVLQKMMMRTENSPCLPKCSCCKNEILSNYFFSCNGRIYHCDCVEDDIGVIGTFYPKAELYEDAVQSFYNRTVLSHSKCADCTYKFVCLGGCPLGARAKGEEMTCGIFEDEEILDNLEFDYGTVLKYRGKKKIDETGKEYSINFVK